MSSKAHLGKSKVNTYPNIKEMQFQQELGEKYDLLRNLFTSTCYWLLFYIFFYFSNNATDRKFPKLASNCSFSLIWANWNII